MQYWLGTDDLYTETRDLYFWLLQFSVRVLAICMMYHTINGFSLPDDINPRFLMKMQGSIVSFFSGKIIHSRIFTIHRFFSCWIYAAYNGLACHYRYNNINILSTLHFLDKLWIVCSTCPKDWGPRQPLLQEMKVMKELLLPKSWTIIEHFVVLNRIESVYVWSNNTCLVKGEATLLWSRVTRRLTHLGWIKNLPQFSINKGRLCIHFQVYIIPESVSFPWSIRPSYPSKSLTENRYYFWYHRRNQNESVELPIQNL